MARMGRPSKELTDAQWEEFKRLCVIQCTQPEIASFFEMSEDTLQRKVKKKFHETFAVVYKRYSERGKSSLRRAQYKLAIEGNPTMLIWLGKNQLQQREPQKDATVEAKGADGSTIKVTFNVTGTEQQLDV